jgi:hypothetical protein
LYTSPSFGVVLKLNSHSDQQFAFSTHNSTSNNPYRTQDGQSSATPWDKTIRPAWGLKQEVSRKSGHSSRL